MVQKRLKRVAIKPQVAKPAKKAVKRSKQPLPKVKANCQAGHVVIPVAGQFRGRRVVVLKQLAKSGIVNYKHNIDVN